MSDEDIEFCLNCGEPLDPDDELDMETGCCSGECFEKMDLELPDDMELLDD